MILKLNDLQDLNVQTAFPVYNEETELNELHIRILHKSFEELESIFNQPLLTQKMTVEEPGLEDVVYENLVSCKKMTKECGGIIEVVMSQTEKSLKEYIANLTKEQKEQAEKLKEVKEQAGNAEREAGAAKKSAETAKESVKTAVREAGSASEAAEKASTAFEKAEEIIKELTQNLEEAYKEIGSLKEENKMLTECMLEMSETVYQ